MRFSHLDDWLHWQASLHSKEIDLGLERVAEVLERMALQQPKHKVVSVAGTNGKGSSVAMLDSILGQAGYRVGRYTSPHFLKYNERIQIAGVPVSDEQICAAFERIDRARGAISLSSFEFETLAAIDIFSRAELDVAVLEVGLGGRLDAVNIIDADVALVTRIGLDHQDWLGDTLEQIAIEKAGIYRSGKAAICADRQVPQSLVDYSNEIGALLQRAEIDFAWEWEAQGWVWWSNDERLEALPNLGLRGDFQRDNAAGVIMAVRQLGLRVSYEAICDGLKRVAEPGRFQIIQGDVPVIMDVAHNPQAAEALAANLKGHECAGRTLAVFQIMQDKDLAGVLGALQNSIDSWYLPHLDEDRACSETALAGAMVQFGIAGPIRTCDNAAAALEKARLDARSGDRIIVFGSFLTVEQILPLVT